MRTAALFLTAAALLTATGCGSDTSATSTDEPTAASDASRTTLKDAATYAARLEQVFFGSGYPQDVAGARTAADKLTDLKLSPGNTIATYTFDASDQEFQLCVENTAGAWSTYDTRPMTTIKSGDSGGCP